MRPWPALALNCALICALLSGCADTPLPDLTVSAGQDTWFGIDTQRGNYTFGFHVTDPLHQRSP